MRIPALLSALALTLAAPLQAQGPAEAPAALPDRVPVTDGIAPVSAAGVIPLPRLGRHLARFSFPAPQEEGSAPAEEFPDPAARTPPERPFPRSALPPVLGPALQRPAHDLLRDLFATGKAAGNHGDLYDNRDRGHSLLPAENHPQLARTAYDDSAREAGLDYGPGIDLLFDAPTLGNSSTAHTKGPFWRSLPRGLLTDPSAPVRLWQNYLAGQIHIYPEHRDHDPRHGDLFPANTPYFLVTQGSSGSDRPHLEAVAMILAAFTPETKAFLRDEGLLSATVQFVFRRSLDTVRSPEAWRSGLAHPSVFPAHTLNIARMVALANSLEPRDVPPLVQMQVISETTGSQGIDWFGEGLEETLFDTPAAIARIWRSSARSREMVVSAAATEDPFGRDITFSWKLLRGDPDRVSIEPLDETGTRARIRLLWQEPRPLAAQPDLRSARIDIGVFASTGGHDSLPGFISVLLPAHETRIYEKTPGGGRRLTSIDYRPGDGVYADPSLFPLTPWSDRHHYGEDGARLGWTRTGEDGTQTRFDAQGRLLPGGAAPRYPLERTPSGTLRVGQAASEP